LLVDEAGGIKLISKRVMTSVGEKASKTPVAELTR
jgi:hypothetical protein